MTATLRDGPSPLRDPYELVGGHAGLVGLGDGNEKHVAHDDSIPLARSKRVVGSRLVQEPVGLTVHAFGAMRATPAII
ncbi:hypothetical protein GCM10007198_19330 [Microbacterium aerolatum]|nr:hypothetical protein GCM10007198_19330 [Microbacterium aerolatum]